MLVPAMTFAWWLVSMSAPGHHRAAVGDSSGPKAEATSERQQQDAEDDEVQPAEAAEGEVSDDPDQGGERVTLKVVTPAIVRAARTYLDLPMGAERTAVIEGQRYVFVLERHYHPPGFVGAPNGWHKGVTVYGVR
jgi:hypothetical protein